MKTQKLDLHLLELRYSHIRIQQPRRIRRLADSIACNSQLIPLNVVSGTEEKFILIDGYQRFAALQLLERDTAFVSVLEISEKEALLQVLVKRGERPWEAIEEAGIIQELKRRFNCSLSEMGKMVGRDKSYIKRRLDLLESLPEGILRLVLSGALSTWAASRVMVPLARANDADAAKLAAHLEKEPLSTRQLKCFHEHYRKSGRQVRERMLDSPSLFLKSLEAMKDEKDESPEGKWLRDIKAVCGILHRLQKNTQTVFYPNQEPKQRNLLMTQASRAERLTQELQQRIKERINHDRSHSGRADQRIEQAGNKPTGDSQDTEHLQEYGSKGAQQQGNQPDSGPGIDVLVPSAVDSNSFSAMPG